MKFLQKEHRDFQLLIEKVGKDPANFHQRKKRQGTSTEEIRWPNRLVKDLPADQEPGTRFSALAAKLHRPDPTQTEADAIDSG